MLTSVRAALHAVQNKDTPAVSQKPKAVQENLNVQEHDSEVTLPVINSEDRVHLKIAFLKYSRLHHHYKLRHSTLFHATSLYINCLHLLRKNAQSFSHDYLTIVCLFLSLKYEEIYPPRLHHITSFLKCPPVDLAIYRQEEKKIVNLLDGDLNVLTPKEIIDELLLKQANEVHSFAYYLLEICFFDVLVPSAYEINEICQAILHIISQSPSLSSVTLKCEREVTKRVVECAKLIASASNRLKTNEIEYIRRKYADKIVLLTSNRQTSLEKEKP